MDINGNCKILVDFRLSYKIISILFHSLHYIIPCDHNNLVDKSLMQASDESCTSQSDIRPEVDIAFKMCTFVLI